MWCCPEGDFRCEVGDYELAAFWPPTQADTWAAPLLAQRFHRYGVSGLSGFWVADRDGQLVARVTARPDADDDLVRAAASPLQVEFTRAPAIGTAREWHPATDREPAHETLALTGAAMRLARLDGALRRAAPEDECDFLVGATRMRLGPDHLIGEPGSPLLMDADGVAFADEGDQVRCGGGYLPHGPVRTDTTLGLSRQSDFRVPGRTSRSIATSSHHPARPKAIASCAEEHDQPLVVGMLYSVCQLCPPSVVWMTR